MNIYLAGQYARRDELKNYADELESLGHNCTSTWLDTTNSLDDSMEAFTEHELYKRALIDVGDIIVSDLVIFFSEKSDNQPPRGGRHVEFGLALAQGKGIFVIGERENIFHHLLAGPSSHFQDWNIFISKFSKLHVATRVLIA